MRSSAEIQKSRPSDVSTTTSSVAPLRVSSTAEDSSDYPPDSLTAREEMAHQATRALFAAERAKAENSLLPTPASLAAGEEMVHQKLRADLAKIRADRNR